MGSSALVLLLMENIDRVPGMDNAEKTQLVAEAKCLIAARYFECSVIMEVFHCYMLHSLVRSQVMKSPCYGRGDC